MNKKVLVVDDTPSIRELIANFLRKSGYQVTEANNGKEAFRKALDTIPDIVVTDVVMPEMNLKIVVCTSKNQDIDRLWGMKQGADIYLTKPFTEEEIMEAINSVVV